MALTETQANTLFNILVENAGHQNFKEYDRYEFVSKFTDSERVVNGEYWFTGEFNDFKLIANFRNYRYYWTMIKQGGQPYPGSRVAKALADTNKALEEAYASGALTGEAHRYAG